MAWAYAAPGIVLIVLVMVDIFWTVITARGAGWLTTVLVRGLHRVLRAAAKVLGGDRLLAAGGPLILCLTLAAWVVLLWTGWWLLFQGEGSAVVSSTSGLPADVIDRLYFVGFTLSTLGIGDLRPGGPLWQVLTALMALNGLVAITLAITYILSVLSAVIAARKLARGISALGSSPAEILIMGYDGRSFAPLESWLTPLVPDVLGVAQSQLAFPILHTFRSIDVVEASPARVALLAEAVLLLRAGVAPTERPAAGVTTPVERAIGQLILTMNPDLEDPPETPPPPDREPLRAAGIALAEESGWAAALDGAAERRRHLNAMVRLDGWSWAEMTGR